MFNTAVRYIEIRTAPSPEQASGIARQAIDVKSWKHDIEYGENLIPVTVNNWTGLIEMMKFAATASAISCGTQLEAEIVAYTTKQSIFFFIPVGPKAMQGYSNYRNYKDALPKIIKAAGPQEVCKPGEIGGNIAPNCF